MRMHILFVVSFLGFAASADFSDLLTSNLFAFNHHERFERDTTRENATCINSCAKSLADGIANNSAMNRTDIRSLQQSALDVCRWYTPNMINGVCSAYQEFSGCFELCPDSKLKRVVNISFETIDYMCVARRADFDKHLPCISRSCDSYDETCGPKCAKQKEGMQHIIQGIRSPKRANVKLDNETLQEIMVKACQYMGCTYNCLGVVLKQKCSIEASHLLADFMKQMITSATKVMAQGIPGLDITLPDECQRLGMEQSTGVNGGGSSGAVGNLTVYW